MPNRVEFWMNQAALAAASTGDTSPEVMAIIDQPRSPAVLVCAPANLEITVS